MRKLRKTGAQIASGEVITFPRMPRVADLPPGWRRWSPTEQIEHLLGMTLDDMVEILSRPIAELDPFRLSVKVQVMRIVFAFGAKALLDGKLGREAARERDAVLEELGRKLATAVKTQAPQAICEVGMASETIGMLVNRTVEPFDNPDLRRAMALTLDRKSFIDILGQGEGEIGGALMPPPDGVWGMPPAMVETLPGYTGDMQKNRDEARALIQKAGYGPDKRLPVKISTRNLAVYRDPAAILIDQLKEIGIDGELETVETAQWVPKLMRKDFKVGLNVLGTAVDDPDVYFYQNYVCSSARNYMGYCDKEFDRMVDQQSTEADSAKRKKLVWDIDHKLQEDLARPVIYHLRAATCWQPEVKGLTMMTNSQYNGWRFEDVWLDK
jgi:peptide/nickel transport system substrate-binding protein